MVPSRLFISSSVWKTSQGVKCVDLRLNRVRPVGGRTSGVLTGCRGLSHLTQNTRVPLLRFQY